MINLLPEEQKAEIRAGRTNVLLLRYIFITFSAVIVLAGLLIGSYVVLDSAKQAAEQKVAENQSRMSAYNDVKAQADAFRTDLATAKSVLDNDVSFTKLIYEIADTVPPNVILNDLDLDPATFGSPVTMNADARSFADAGKLKDAFVKNSQIFSNVRLQSLSSDAGSSSNGGYPVKVTLSLIINKGALK